MEVEDTNIPGVWLLKPRYFYHPRGYFVETYNKHSARDLGLTACFVQDNQSLSVKRGTVRALHFQIPPKTQAKLVRVLRGSIYDVALDLRLGSPTYGRWTAVTLTANPAIGQFAQVRASPQAFRKTLIRRVAGLGCLGHFR